MCHGCMHLTVSVGDMMSHLSVAKFHGGLVIYIFRLMAGDLYLSWIKLRSLSFFSGWQMGNACMKKMHIVSTISVSQLQLACSFSYTEWFIECECGFNKHVQCDNFASVHTFRKSCINYCVPLQKWSMCLAGVILLLSDYT